MKLRYNDKVHGYWLDGKRCKGVSTCAKIPDDSYGLDTWRKRMVAIGVANNMDLAMHVLAAGSDRNKLDELAEQAMTEAGAHLAAEAGTAAHTRTEKHDAGEAVEDFEMQLVRWRGMLASAGLEIVTDLIERVVVYPEQRICGRFDRMARRLSDGRLVTIDLKTGTSAVKYPHAVATQLAMYANAPLLAGAMVEVDEGVEETTSFSPLPEDLDRETGYLMHLPEDGEAAVYAVNLKLGWQVTQEVIFPTLRWRSVPVNKVIKKLVA